MDAKWGVGMNMKVLVKNGFIVFDWEGKPNKPKLENNDLLALPSTAWKFLNEIRRNNYELNEPYVDLRYGPYKLSSNPYLAFVQLRWVRGKANRNGIERDESFEDLYRSLWNEYDKSYDACEKEYVATRTERAQKAWEEELAKRNVRQDCSMCFYCEEIMEGDLRCRKYRKELDFKLGERYDMVSGRHYMFSEIGIPCDECREADTKGTEEEKARFIKKYINEFRDETIEQMTADMMNKGVASYV